MFLLFKVRVFFFFCFVFSLHVDFASAQIFQSLSSHDLPEFFEDHLPEFAALMKKYLEFSSKALLNEHGGDEEKAGNIEKVRTSIVQICELYTQKYAEEFTMLGSFVETVWGLLVSTGTQSKYDMVTGVFCLLVGLFVGWLVCALLTTVISL